MRIKMVDITEARDFTESRYGMQCVTAEFREKNKKGDLGRLKGEGETYLYKSALMVILLPFSCH